MGFINTIVQHMPDNFSTYYAQATFWATMCGSRIPNNLYGFRELGSVIMPTAMQISDTLHQLHEFKDNKMYSEFFRINPQGLSSRNYMYLQAIIEHGDCVLEECRNRYYANSVNNGNSSTFVHSNGYTSSSTVYKGGLNFLEIEKDYPGISRYLDGQITKGFKGHPIYVSLNGDGTCDVCVLTHGPIESMGFVPYRIDTEQRMIYMSDFVYRIPVDYLNDLVAVTENSSETLIAEIDKTLVGDTAFSVKSNNYVPFKEKSSALLASVTTVLEHMNDRQSAAITPLKLAICNGVPLRQGNNVMTPETFRLNKIIDMNKYTKFVDLKESKKLALKMDNFDNWRK